VRLHEAWVFDAIVGGGCSDTAVGFLHHDCEDEAGVYAAGCCYGADGALDAGDFVVGGVGDVPLRAAAFDIFQIVGEPFKIC